MSKWAGNLHCARALLHLKKTATPAIAVSRGYFIINYQEGGQHGKT